MLLNKKIPYTTHTSSKAILPAETLRDRDPKARSLAFYEVAYNQPGCLRHFVSLLRWLDSPPTNTDGKYMLKFMKDGEHVVGYMRHTADGWQFDKGVELVREGLQEGEICGLDNHPLRTTDSKERLETELPVALRNPYLRCVVVPDILG
jgi:hypothetical protein